MAFAWACAREVLGGCGVMFSGGGFVGGWGRRKGEEGSVASCGMGVGCGRQFLTYGCVGCKNGAANWIGLIRALDDGRRGDVVGSGFACLGVGWVGKW